MAPDPPAPDPALRPVLAQIRDTAAALPHPGTDDLALVAALARLARLASYGIALAAPPRTGGAGVDGDVDAVDAGRSRPEDRCPSCGGRAWTDGTEAHTTDCRVPAARLAAPARVVDTGTPWPPSRFGRPR